MRSVLTGVLTGLALAHSAQAVDLGGKTVPKEKFIVYLLIGHSNMSGWSRNPDTQTHPRCWSFANSEGGYARFVYPSGGQRWQLAKDPIWTASFIGPSGGVAMPFLKKMAQRYPDYYFGVIQLATTIGTVKMDEGGLPYWKGSYHFNELMGAARQVKDQATFGGILAMLGLMEGSRRNRSETYARNFSDHARQMVADMRGELGLPELPFLIGQYEMGASGDEWDPTKNYAPIVIQEINRIPGKVSRSAVIDTVGCEMIDDHHFNVRGYDLWSDRVVDTIVNKGWGPSPSVPANRPPTVRLIAPAGGANFREGEDIVLRADAADADGRVRKVEFFRGSSKLGEVTSAPYRYTWQGASPGRYTLTARATDDAGAVSTSEPVTVSVTAGGTNAPPKAEIRADTFANVGETVTFDGGGSADPDGSIQSYTWRFGDGTTAAGKVATHAWSAPGSFEVSLIVQDDGGARHEARITVKVIVEPSVTLLSPVGGEVWPAGSVREIRWTVQNLEDVEIQYSTDGGGTWTYVTYSDDSRPDWGRYAWTVPDQPSERCLVRIAAYFGGTEAQSGPFQITSGPDLAPPVIWTVALGIGGALDDPLVATVTVGGVEFPLGQGTFRGEFSLASGTTTVAMSAQDAAGNTAARALNVQVVP